MARPLAKDWRKTPTMIIADPMIYAEYSATDSHFFLMKTHDGIFPANLFNDPPQPQS